MLKNFTSLQLDTFKQLLDYDLSDRDTDNSTYSEIVEFQEQEVAKFKENVYLRIQQLKTHLEKQKNTPLNFGNVRDAALLDSCLTSPFNSYFDIACFPTIADKAFALLSNIVKSHPFIDGNKRIAALVFLDFLYLHQEKIDKPIDELFTPHTLSTFVIQIAKSNKEELKGVENLFKALIPLKNATKRDK